MDQPSRDCGKPGLNGTAEFAVRLNAVCESLPIQEIAPTLVALVATGTTGLK